ncbi:hypothetical protein HMPREF1434_01414 [Helicobacter pylori GAMchJs124i]|nr:hypothetical protein HMPREF1434_01414 [Helicobacter pylori GAMchJs124i]
MFLWLYEARFIGAWLFPINGFISPRSCSVRYSLFNNLYR